MSYAAPYVFVAVAGVASLVLAALVEGVKKIRRSHRCAR